MKVAGSRQQPAGALLDWDKFVELAWSFRKDRVFVPRGVYRFRTFEEASRWEAEMMLGKKPPSAGSRPRKT